MIYSQKSATVTEPSFLLLLLECPIGTFVDVVGHVCLRCPPNSHTDGEYTSIESCICDAGFQPGGQGQEHCVGKFPMITLSDGNLFHATGPLCGEFAGHRWIPLTKASDAELWCFLWSAPRINGWVITREAGDYRRHRAHYDVAVMQRRRQGQEHCATKLWGRNWFLNITVMSWHGDHFRKKRQ